MNAEQYARWTAPLRGRHAKVIPRLDRTLTAIVYAAYPLLLLWHWRCTKSVPWPALWVPASSLMIVSLLRRLIDRSRPYERLAIEPLISKNTRGRSMPSRHAFSVFVIAVTGGAVWWPAGVALVVIGVVLCVTRVLGGVHDLWDVIVGAVIGLLAGIVGYALLPF